MDNEGDIKSKSQSKRRFMGQHLTRLLYSPLAYLPHNSSVPSRDYPNRPWLRALVIVHLQPAGYQSRHTLHSTSWSHTEECPPRPACHRR